MTRQGTTLVKRGEGLRLKSGNPAQRAAMVGINVEEIPQPHRLAQRGW